MKQTLLLVYPSDTFSIKTVERDLRRLVRDVKKQHGWTLMDETPRRADGYYGGVLVMINFDDGNLS